MKLGHDSYFCSKYGNWHHLFLRIANRFYFGYTVTSALSPIATVCKCLFSKFCSSMKWGLQMVLLLSLLHCLLFSFLRSFAIIVALVYCLLYNGFFVLSFDWQSLHKNRTIFASSTLAYNIFLFPHKPRKALR